MGIEIALAGNPNCGKTTLFNTLTGSNQFVGNWPGVTVEKKEGRLKSNNDVVIVDLPGIYSLSPYTPEEIVARNYLVDERPDVILNIVDGSNLERNLYLSTQLIELGIPVVIAINMMDVVEKKGDRINSQNLEKELGCKVVEISALKNTGISEAAEAAINSVKNEKKPLRHNFSGDVEHTIAHIEEAILHDIPEDRQRWYAIKLFERDKQIIAKLKIDQSLLKHIEEDIKQCETWLDDDSESIITTERYNYIDSIIKDCREIAKTNKLSVSDKIDNVVTNRFLALPIFALAMFIVYFISVTTVGSVATEWVSNGIFGAGWNLFGLWIPGIPVIIEALLQAINCADWLQRLVLDGIIAGVGSVLGFVPQLFVLFIFLAFLEACGYMSRIAFIMDRIFRKFGLSGKSFIPILIGTGCGVPSIMSSRTIENDKDRKMTIITATFIPCSAKLPIIALIAGALFGGVWWVAPSVYMVGIAAIVCSGIILKKTKLFAGEPSAFVMELPPYHMPTVRNILRSMWERGWSFIKKAGTIILISGICVWFASNYGYSTGTFTKVEMSDSILASIGSVIARIFVPLGWGNWQSSVAVLTGIIAKENIVSTLVVLFGQGEASGPGSELWGSLTSNFSPISSYSFLVFNLLCVPCIAAVGAIRREMNNTKWFFFAILYQCGFAYLISLFIYQFGMLFIEGAFGIGTIAAILFLAFFFFLLFRKKNVVKRL